ncbi:hypothetical protein [Bradyrhizobium sp. LMG 9283]|uniref:hypothetical protein n=1 Tax=Bradyrhizobium sp. LMG 9283 TaxID=592064 RepID=UPI0038907810
MPSILWRQRMRVRQNRVVLAVVATVKPIEDAREPNRADGIVNSNGEGGQKELGSREQLC